MHRREFWNLNRKSVSKGVSIGIFWAFIPLPFQMVIATIFAFIFRGNIAISLTLVWITNPLTMPFIYYFCYKIGVVILGKDEMPFVFNPSYEWVILQFNNILVPLFTGSFIVATILSFSSYHLINYMWYLGTKRDVINKNRKFKIFTDTDTNQEESKIEDPKDLS